MVSSAVALTLVAPPKPFQRATGTRHSRPLASASSASRRLLSQLASQRSGSLVKASPSEQFDPNRPSLSVLPSTRPLFRAVICSGGNGERVRALVLFLPAQHL